MLKRKFSFVLILFLLTATSCMNMRVVSYYDSDNIQPHEATKVTLFWGLLQARDIPAECESNSLCSVTAQTNIGFILLSAVTVGIVVPQKVLWQCCPVNEEEEVLE